jgi:hypothetical protein
MCRVVNMTSGRRRSLRHDGLVDYMDKNTDDDDENAEACTTKTPTTTTSPSGTFCGVVCVRVRGVCVECVQCVCVCVVCVV